MKNSADYGQSTRIENLEKRVADLEEALVHSIYKRVNAKLPVYYPDTSGEGIPIPFSIARKIISPEPFDSKEIIKDILIKCMDDKIGEYPKPVEEAYKPPKVINNGGPYALSYSTSRVEKHVATTDDLTHARGLAELYAKSCGVAIKVRDKDGNLIVEFRSE